jgi:subtilisin family serine protease
MQNFTYHIGGLQGVSQSVQMSPDKLVIRTSKAENGTRKDVLLPKEYLDLCEKRFDVPTKGVAVFDVQGTDPQALRDEMRVKLPKNARFAFAGRALQHPLTKEPAIYTENLYLRFADRVKPRQRTEFLQRWKLEVTREWKFAEGAYLIKLPDGTGTETFALAEALLHCEELALCQPEVLWHRSTKAIHAQQWHLAAGALQAHAHVQEAHAISTGKGVCIAILDDGVELKHPEFSAFGKCHAPYNFVRRNTDANPVAAGDAHGTHCAGVACAAGVHAPGVAPDATLMPLVIPSNTIGSMAEAEAIA